ncbi:hypothetical protein QQ73_00400 [Candidatus Endoriftia persephone str. Guaymas]|nr:hypothetical protein [Candidatus Endoriftia persephone str. Guaymas]
MLIDMTELTIFAHKIKMIGPVLVFDYSVTIEAVCLVRDMLFMHQCLVTCGSQKCLAPVMTCETTIGDYVTGLNLSLTFHYLKMAALTGYTRFLHSLMCDWPLGCTLITYL